jgi:hypothetical protein
VKKVFLTKRHCAFMLYSMMRKNIPIKLSFAVALTFALNALFTPSSVLAQKISKTARAGDYSITLKVLPAESFGGMHAAMTRDGGAKPNLLNGPEHPNHHLVAFVRKDGKPVEKATVFISCREVAPKKSDWMPLPVVRMHVTGKGLKTTHYGNNLKLGPGSYEARVVVNESKPAIFRFTLTR